MNVEIGDIRIESRQFMGIQGDIAIFSGNMMIGRIFFIPSQFGGWSVRDRFDIRHFRPEHEIPWVTEFLEMYKKHTSVEYIEAAVCDAIMLAK